jgi:hypothetical protein
VVSVAADLGWRGCLWPLRPLQHEEYKQSVHATEDVMQIAFCNQHSKGLPAAGAWPAVAVATGNASWVAVAAVSDAAPTSGGDILNQRVIHRHPTNKILHTCDAAWGQQKVCMAARMW